MTETCAVCRRVGTLVRGTDTCNACTPVPEGTWSEGVLALRGGRWEWVGGIARWVTDALRAGGNNERHSA